MEQPCTYQSYRPRDSVSELRGTVEVDDTRLPNGQPEMPKDPGRAWQAGFAGPWVRWLAGLLGVELRTATSVSRDQKGSGDRDCVLSVAGGRFGIAAEQRRSRRSKKQVCRSAGGLTAAQWDSLVRRLHDLAAALKSAGFSWCFTIRGN